MHQINDKEVCNNDDQQLYYLSFSNNIPMHSQPPMKPQPYSLLASMYQSWQQYHIPAIYYHYLLSVMPKLQKKQQMLIMARQVKSLKANTHPYHKIINAIQARERSLEIIRQYVDVFTEYQSTDQMDWPNADQASNSMELQFDNYPGSKGNTINNVYKVSHEDPRSPLLSPSLRSPEKHKQSKLHQLLNHLKLYQKLTTQIILMIFEWQLQLQQMGYKESVIQFQYHKQDYLQRINTDTTQILDKYQNIFENNPFLMMKKIHEKSEYALVYRDLRLSQEMLAKVHECLNIIAGHQAEILKWRMLAKVNQTGNRKRIIAKSTDIDKIYKNYNNGRDYIVIKDSETMKKSRVYHQPLLSKNRNINSDPIVGQQHFGQENSRLKSLKNSIIVNPESRLLTIDRTQRKHPVKSNLLNLMYNNPSNSPQIYLKGIGKQANQIVNSRKIRSQKSANVNGSVKLQSGLKRSLTEDQIGIKRSASVMLNEAKKKEFGANLSGAQFRERVEVKPVHRQNQIFVGQRDNNNREDEIDRNKGLSTQKKLQMMDKVNSQLKLKNKSYVQIKQEQLQKKQNIQALPLKQIQSSPQITPEPPAQLPQSNQITLTFQQSIRPTQIVKYLRQKVFKTSPDISFDQIQNLAKKILAQKQYITFIRVECKNMNVAWMAVKFLEKDNIMRRSVFVMYVRKFVRLSGFQRKLLEKFVEHGYGVIRNQQKILFQVDLIDIVVRPLLKIKYKINPTVSQPQLKKLLKKTPTLSQSRILKYHTYSKQSKYHSYCQHQKTHCQISYNFLQLSKITIDRSQYIKAKVDKITKLSQNLYRIVCNVNQTDLIVGNVLADIIGLEKEVEIEKDSSFQNQGQDGAYRYVAIKEGKIMKKYVNEAEEVLLCQFVTLNGNIPEVRSITMSKEQVKEEVLILEPPFFMAIMTRDVGEAKTLAVLQFS